MEMTVEMYSRMQMAGLEALLDYYKMHPLLCRTVVVGEKLSSSSKGLRNDDLGSDVFAD